MSDNQITFTYRNWRGEVAQRVVRPIAIRFGATEYHPRPQWLMQAFDLEKQAVRDFAMSDLSDIDPADLRISLDGGSRTPGPGTFVCHRCHQMLDADAFKRRANGNLMPWCAECKRAYDADAVARKRAAGR